jgi:hypothetical protein
MVEPVAPFADPSAVTDEFLLISASSSHAALDELAVPVAATPLPPLSN